MIVLCGVIKIEERADKWEKSLPLGWFIKCECMSYLGAQDDICDCARLVHRCKGKLGHYDLHKYKFN